MLDLKFIRENKDIVEASLVKRGAKVSISRAIELDEICGVVLKYNDQQGFDSPYTRTVSTLLEYVYENEQ